MEKREIRSRVYWLGVVDWDRRLFDSLVPLPDGTSYNAYLIQGSAKTALLDTVDPAVTEMLLAQLADVPEVHYIVSQHAEQDHSGSIPHVLAKYPQAQVIATEKGKDLLMLHLGIPAERITAVADGEELSLGDRTLRFLHTPWAHWPETMSTYLVEERILFSCDLFGSHLATSDLYVTDEGLAYEGAKRYFAEIMMPFRRFIQRNVDKVRALPLDLIAPSHGPIYGRPEFILEAYRAWLADAPKNVVVIPYISMHGSTRLMVQRLVSALVARGVTVHQFDLAATDIGKLAMALVDAATLVVGTPTVHVGPHPNVAHAAVLANVLRPNLRYAAVIGSYGWGTKAVEQVAGMIPNLKVEILGTVLAKGAPTAADYAALDQLAETIAAKHREAGLA